MSNRYRITVGGTKWEHPEAVWPWIDILPQGSVVVVSKHATGAQEIAAQRARARGLLVDEVFLKDDPLETNVMKLKPLPQAVVVFHPWLPNSRLTMHLITHAMVRQIPVILCTRDEPSPTPVEYLLASEPIQPDQLLEILDAS